MRATRWVSLGTIALVALAGCGRLNHVPTSKELLTRPFVTQGSIQPHWQSGGHNTVSLLSVRFFGARKGIAAGSFGTSYGIFSTTTGGQRWQLLSTLPKIFNLDMLSLSQGWATTCRQAGCSYPDELQETVDGGKTWHTVYRSGSHMLMGPPDFVTPNTGFMVDTIQSTQSQTTSLIKTTDGGIQWTRLPSPIQFPGNLGAAIDFVNTRDGWLLAGGEPSAGYQRKSLYATQNGGLSWKRIASSGPLGSPTGRTSLPGGGYVDTLDFLNGSQGYLPLNRGPILVTHDGGRQFRPVWTQIFSPGTSMVLSLSFPSATTGYVLTTFSGMNTLWRTANDGRTWNVVYPPLEPNGPTAFAGRQLGAGIDTTGYQSSEVLLTKNGGRSWTLVNRDLRIWGSPYWGPHHTLWVSTAGGQLWYSADEGSHFSPVSLPGHDRIESLAINPETRTITAAMNTAQGMTVFRMPLPSGTQSVSSGHWQAVSWPVSPDWFSTPASHDVWAIGTDITASRALAQFERTHPNNPKAVKQYTVKHPLTLYLYHANSQGQWTRYLLPKSVSASNEPLGLVFTSRQFGYFWTSTTLYVTHNGGKNWTPLATGQSNPLYGVSFISPFTAWITFADGSRLLTTIK